MAASRLTLDQTSLLIHRFREIPAVARLPESHGFCDGQVVSGFIMKVSVLMVRQGVYSSIKSLPFTRSGVIGSEFILIPW